MLISLVVNCLFRKGKSMCLSNIYSPYFKQTRRSVSTVHYIRCCPKFSPSDAELSSSFFARRVFISMEKCFSSHISPYDFNVLIFCLLKFPLIWMPYGQATIRTQQSCSGARKPKPELGFIKGFYCEVYLWIVHRWELP